LKPSPIAGEANLNQANLLTLIRLSKKISFNKIKLFILFKYTVFIFNFLFEIFYDYRST